jgi:hypothetical protein
MSDWLHVGWVKLRSEPISHCACGQNLLCSEDKSWNALSLLCKSMANWHPISCGMLLPLNYCFLWCDANVNFEYFGFLEDDPSCTTFCAWTCTEPAQVIVMKFIDCYRERAHCILVEVGLAPKVLYCGPLQLDMGQPSYHLLCMVVSWPSSFFPSLPNLTSSNGLLTPSCDPMHPPLDSTNLPEPPPCLRNPLLPVIHY